jgi:TRAP-type transport system periplasmic protein
MKTRGLGVVLACFMLGLAFPGAWVYAAEKPIKLVYADMVPEVTVGAQCAKWWGSEIEKRTQGKVKFDYYFGASLVGAYEQLTSVTNNVIQVTPYYSGYHPDVAPIPLMALFPLMNIGSLQVGLKAADQFFRNNPDVQKEFKKNNVKYMNPLFTANAYMWAKVPVNTIADFKGLSVRAFGPWLTLFEAMGSSMVSVPVPEIYNSLERGVVKSTLLYLTNGVGLNLMEVTQYLNTTNLGHNCGMPMVMNLDAWNKLPKDVQEVIEELNVKEAVPTFGRVNFRNYEREMKIAKDKGMKLSEFSPSDVEKMIDIAKEKVWYPYAKGLDKKGLNGTEILNDYLQYVKKYK